VITEPIGWLLLAVLVALLVTVYFSWTAGRIDRMNARLETARAALDAQRHRRSSVAIEIAVAGLLDPAAAVVVADSAHRARAAAPEDVELAENDLTRALGVALAEPPADLDEEPDEAGLGHELLDELEEVARRLQLARRFHNDAVRATAALRAHRMVRWLRLAGHSPPPRAIDFDDSTPPGIESYTRSRGSAGRP